MKILDHRHPERSRRSRTANGKRWRNRCGLGSVVVLVGIVLLILVRPGGADKGRSDSGDSPASWMRCFHQPGTGLDALTLDQICVPGTHDSGAYQVLGKMAKLVSRWVVTQQLDLREQLEAGARKLDLRVMKISAGDGKKLEPGFYLHHGGFATVSLAEGLEQIGAYLESEAAKTETVLLEFAHLRGVQGRRCRMGMSRRGDLFRGAR